MIPINLTPHPVHLHCTDGTVLTFQPSTPAARVRQTFEPLPTLRIGAKEARTFTASSREVIDMPPPEDGYVYIVSALVASSLAKQGRTEDVFSPGDLVRDEQGRVIGCRSLLQQEL